LDKKVWAVKNVRLKRKAGLNFLSRKEGEKTEVRRREKNNGGGGKEEGNSGARREKKGEFINRRVEAGKTGPIRFLRGKKLTSTERGRMHVFTVRKQELTAFAKGGKRLRGTSARRWGEKRTQL